MRISRAGLVSLALCASLHLCASAAVNPVHFSDLPAAAQTKLSGAFGQLAELTASDGGPVSFFGYSIAVSGSTVAVGADLDPANGASAVGAVYVFVKAGSGWENMTQVAKLTPSDGVAGTEMGISVAISGDTIVAGASGLSESGPVYVFVKPPGGWTDMTQTAELSPTDGSSADVFGNSVALSGDTIVVGSAIGAYVYVRPPAGWVDATQTAKLSDGVADELGPWVTIQGDIVAATPLESGSVCVFAKPPGGWTNTSAFIARLSPSDGADSQFGLSLGISGRTIVVGAPRAHGTGQSPPGAVYVYEEPTSGWVSATETAELTVVGQPTEELGYSVGVSGNFIVAGAPDARGGMGAAYLYSAPAGGWVTTSSYVKRVTAGSSPNEVFGLSTAINGPTIFIGAPLLNIGYNIEQGAAFVFGP